jgi:hypothetical protein
MARRELKQNPYPNDVQPGRDGGGQHVPAPVEKHGQQKAERIPGEHRFGKRGSLNNSPGREEASDE